MPYSWVDNFYVMDPWNPPSAGSSLTAVDFVVTDRNSNGQMSPGSRDTVDGQRFYAAYPGDTVTVQLPGGATKTITGVTFYLRDGRQVFSPTDGSTLQDATFVSATWVSGSGSVSNSAMEMVVCFAAGTLIAVPGGARRVESLAVGDEVQTLDNGVQSVRWVGRKTVTGRGEFAPIRFMPGAIGNSRELRVSPQHRMLVAGWRVELQFGEPEMLVAAKHLVNGDTIHIAPCDTVDYVHLCFDRHEIVLAEDAPAESFLPGEYILEADRGIARELMALFPEMPVGAGGGWAPARPLMKGREAALLS